MSSVTVVQLSDTHFLEAGAAPEGGGAYDTSTAFDAVLAHVREQPTPDLTVVTGDVADHGRPEQYRLAAEALARLPGPVNVCAGNHDRAIPFTVGLGRPGLSTSRIIEVGPWAMVFVDSCAGLLRPDAAGLPVDPPGDERLHCDGLLGTAEVSWVRQVVAASAAEHVFVWLHHPPSTGIPLFRNEPYLAEWTGLLRELPRIRAFGCGHTHVPTRHEIEGRPVFVAPSLKTNFDLDEGTWLPPGYRSYELHDDGAVSSDVHLVDDERWPRRRFGRAIRSLFAGELTHAELAEIVARKTAAN